MRMTQTLGRAAQTRASHSATIFGDRRRSWAEVQDRVSRAAGGMMRLGVGPGDRVAVLALNSDVYLEMYYSVPWAGGVLVPLNTRWAEPELLFAVRDCEPKILCVDEHFAGCAAALAKAAAVTAIVYVGEGVLPDGMIAYEDLAGGPPADDTERSDEDLFAIFYTGGTTGHPKGVMLSHRNVVLSGLNWNADLRFDDDTVFLHVAGLFHLAGAAPAIALTMAAGAHVLVPKFDVVEACRTIQRERVNFTLMVPTMLNSLVNHSSLADFDLTSVRMCEYGGSPMPEALVLAAQEKLPTWRFIQGYGLTETTAVVVCLRPDRHVLDGPKAGKLNAIGRPSYIAEVRVVDPQGRDTAPGEVGEIIVRGPVVTSGYWRNPEATASALRGGWLYTGDGARLDEDGFIYLVDRIKDMIISGGENVYSAEVENAVYGHPAVQECAVIGVPDAYWGEAVHAVVVLKAGAVLDADELRRHCRSRIAGYKCPRSFTFRAEPLPKSAAGKITKHVLRAEYRAGASGAPTRPEC